MQSSRRAGFRPANLRIYGFLPRKMVRAVLTGIDQGQHRFPGCDLALDRLGAEDFLEGCAVGAGQPGDLGAGLLAVPEVPVDQCHVNEARGLQRLSVTIGRGHGEAEILGISM